MSGVAASIYRARRYRGWLPIAGRTRPEVEGLIGFFVNTMVLRMDLSNDPTSEEVLAQARDVALGAYIIRSFPLSASSKNPKRDLNTTPLFRVMLPAKCPRVPAEFAGLETNPVEVPSGEAKFDLFLAVLEKITA
jgi:non-ribosomal peptide synthetase component F